MDATDAEFLMVLKENAGISIVEPAQKMDLSQASSKADPVLTIRETVMKSPS
jgi:DNA-binding Lrp family transcriptional regulator